jgi:ubiquitin carboxyl-terminal hydrolase 8
MNGHPIANGLPSAPITYPQVPRRISPTASGSNSATPGAAFSPPPPIYQSIASPPQASINLSRKRSDYIDQSQEALYTLNNVRTTVDYPEIVVPQISRPPPAASSTLERQDKRVQQVPQTPGPQTIEPKPPRIESDYPVTFWSDLQVSTSGLKNMGNTCYMNATIQCLIAIVPFARFFLGEYHLEYGSSTASDEDM